MEIDSVVQGQGLDSVALFSIYYSISTSCKYLCRMDSGRVLLWLCFDAGRRFVRSDEILANPVEVKVQLPRLLLLVAFHSMPELPVGVLVGQIVQ
jgi:hypothetical protein